jgi:hypothetical protein
MDGEARDQTVRMLMDLHGLDAGEAEIGTFKTMLEAVGEGVGRLYTMKGIRYAEPAPIFRVAPDAPRRPA